MKTLCEEDLRRVVWLSDPALSDDGRYTAWVRAVSDYATGKLLPEIMLLSRETGVRERGSRNTLHQLCPRFSPDGKFLAFLDADGPFPQVWIRELGSEREQKITGFRYGAAEYAWLEDSSGLLVCAPAFGDSEPFPEMSSGEACAFLEKEKHSPRITEELMYKLDEAGGFISGRRNSLYRVNLEDGKCTELAGPALHAVFPADAGDGTVYFMGHPYKREKSLRPALYRVRDGKCEQMECLFPPSEGVGLMPVEGGVIYAGFCAERGRVELIRKRERGEETLMAALEGEGAEPSLLGDDRAAAAGRSAALDRNGGLYLLTARNARTCIVRTGDGKTVLDQGCIQAFAPPRAGVMPVLMSTSVSPAALYELEMESGKLTLVADENSWTREYSFVQPEPLNKPVPGWVLMPDGNGACPGILYVHGGPECFYGEEIFFFEAQSLRSAGYAVMYCNPRGSAGYGPGHLDGAYGEEAVSDLLGFVDEAVRKFGRIDPGRIGVTGGSYGGYMTNRLTMLTDRFRAAAAQRTWIDPVTSYGTGDMGFISGSGTDDFRAYMLKRAKSSVIRDIAKLNTPTLILHGETDVRCGVEQADQVFNCIRALRPELPCRLVIFPGENHNLTRGGLMHHRIRHMLEIRRWMDRFLKEEEASNATEC